MALDFPPSPTEGQVYTLGAKSWTWNGSGWASVPASTVNQVDPSTIPTMAEVMALSIALS